MIILNIIFINKDIIKPHTAATVFTYHKSQTVEPYFHEYTCNLNFIVIHKTNNRSHHVIKIFITIHINIHKQHFYKTKKNVKTFYKFFFFLVNPILIQFVL